MRGSVRVLLVVARWRVNRKGNRVRCVFCPEREEGMEIALVVVRLASKNVALSLEFWS